MDARRERFIARSVVFYAIFSRASGEWTFASGFRARGFSYIFLFASALLGLVSFPRDFVSQRVN